VELEGAGSAVGPATGAGRLVAGPGDSPEPASSSALRLPASWEVAERPPETVPLSPTYTVGLLFFPRLERAIRSSARMAGGG